jgi:hypothetical protein
METVGTTPVRELNVSPKVYSFLNQCLRPVESTGVSLACSQRIDSASNDAVFRSCITALDKRLHFIHEKRTRDVSELLLELVFTATRSLDSVQDMILSFEEELKALHRKFEDVLPESLYISGENRENGHKAFATFLLNRSASLKPNNFCFLRHCLYVFCCDDRRAVGEGQW